MNWTHLISATFLAAIFLFSGIDKTLHYSGFVNALSSYAVVPGSLAATLAPAVILAELWIGAGLLLRPWRQTAAACGAVLLMIFTAALAINQIYAPGAVCGCWFTFTLAESTGAHIAQNLVLSGLSWTLWLQARRPKTPGSGPPSEPLPRTPQILSSGTIPG